MAALVGYFCGLGNYDNSGEALLWAGKLRRLERNMQI